MLVVRKGAGYFVFAVALVALALVGCGGDDEKENSKPAAKAAKPAPPRELPRGGRTLFPDYRVVAFYGAPQTPALGILGIGSPDQAVRKLKRQARKYERPGRPALPAVELISTVASGAAGLRRKYSYRQTRRQIDRYLKAARSVKALLILDVQPGSARFIDEVRRLRPYLEQPDVALALDPEWAVKPGQVPGRQLGTTNASEINKVSRYLAKLVREEQLPEKLLIVHAFTEDVLSDGERAKIKPREGIALVVNADGFGSPEAKADTYRRFARRRYANGFKLFYEEDTRVMSPSEVLGLKPRPDVVTYE